jgi:hypothetical protein
MGMPLAAKANDSDWFVLQAVKVGLIVVVEFCHNGSIPHSWATDQRRLR